MRAPLLLLCLSASPSLVLGGEDSREERLRLIREDSSAPAPAAAKPLPKPSAKVFEPKSMDEAEAILLMPEFKVSARPVDPIELKLRKLAPVFAELQRQHEQALEATEPTWLDSVLNHPAISIFGGYNADARAAQARARVESLSLERMLLIALAQAQTDEEKADIQSILAAMRAARR